MVAVSISLNRFHNGNFRLFERFLDGDSSLSDSCSLFTRYCIRLGLAVYLDLDVLLRGRRQAAIAIIGRQAAVFLW